MSYVRTGAFLARAAAEGGSLRGLHPALRRRLSCSAVAADCGPGGRTPWKRHSSKPPILTLGTRHCSSSNNSSGSSGSNEGNDEAGSKPVSEPPAEEPAPIEQSESSTSEAETVVDGTNHDPYMHGLTRVTVPDIFPNVPVICVSRTPIFPRFVKTMFLRDQRVIDLITRKCKLGQPYVGVFMRRDDNNAAEVISSLDEVHPVGVFAQVVELHHSKGGQTNILLAAHRRIRISGEFVEDISLEPEEMVAPTEKGPAIELVVETTPVSDLEHATAGADAESDKKAPEEEAKEEEAVPAEPAMPEEVPKARSVVEAPPFGFLTRVRGPFGPITPGRKSELDKDVDVESFEPKVSVEQEQEQVKPNIGMVTTTNVYHMPYKRDTLVKALAGEVLSTLREIIVNSPIYRDTLSQVIADGKFVVGDNPAHLADFGAALANADPLKLQEVLEERLIPKRLELSLQLLKQQLDVCHLQQKLAKDVEEKVSATERKYHLNEQLKIIKKELGMEKDNKEALTEKFKARLEDLTVPTDVQEVIDEELNKLGFLDENSSEFSVTRNYLDWLTAIKWGHFSDENFEIQRAKTILDEDHYGMKPIKERILEFIAVGQLQGSVQGKILFFVGPPGVGKTSIARSIARSLNREYFRFSVGGMSDVAEIKGHRRTYVGAMPGKLIQCLKKTKSCNPVVVIDEVDKVAHRSVHGDPQSALLEVLDPEQNSSFLDHYLDVPVDLSKILFICTGNSIPAEFSSALLDRMEVIEVSGYMAHEKLEIAKRYLMPKARSDSGVHEDRTSIADGAIDTLIRSYARESGVRGLQKQIEKIYRKAAYKIVEQLPATKETIAVDEKNLSDFVGKQIYMSDRLYDTTPPGVVMGLSWTASGGAPLYLEITNRYRGTEGTQGSLITTGSLGKVLQESASIAYSFSRVYTMQHFPDKINDLVTSTLHLHSPQGAIPKDGPSAGVAIVSALLSLTLNQPLRQNTAMTGEVSLRGKVLRVGGIKEKVLGARRAGVECVVLPEENRCDWDELDAVLRDGIQAHFVTHYADVFPIVFEARAAAAVASVSAPGGGSSERKSSEPAGGARTPSSGGELSLWQRLLRVVGPGEQANKS